MMMLENPTMNLNANQRPVSKVSDSADQTIVRLVLHSLGRPKTIRAEGCSFITTRERFQVKLSVKVTERFTDSWINAAVVLRCCLVHCTTQPGAERGFGHWLQLVCCA